MANQPETATYDAGVYQWATTDPVTGGAGGIANAPLLNLANRTAYLKSHVDALEAASAGWAPLNSPALTGSPTAPNVAAGDMSTKIANTNFVAAALASQVVKPVGGGVNVTLVQSEWGAGILKFTGALTANIAVIFPSIADRWIVENATTGAYTLTCKTAAGTGALIKQGRRKEIWGDATNIYDVRTDFDAVGLTGASTADPLTLNDNSTGIVNAQFMNSTMNQAFGSSSALTFTPAPSAGAADPHTITLSGGPFNFTSNGVLLVVAGCNVKGTGLQPILCTLSVAYNGSTTGSTTSETSQSLSQAIQVNAGSRTITATYSAPATGLTGFQAVDLYVSFLFIPRPNG
jgi:hypothetical protein